MRVLPSGPQIALGSRTEQQDSAAVVIRPRVAIAVVCDGVGSTPDAALCAALATEAAVEHLSVLGARRRTGSYLMATERAVVQRLNAAVSSRMLHREAKSTLAAAAILGDVCWAVTMGDSRVTLVRDGRVVATTTPHSEQFQAALGITDGRGGSGPHHLTRWLAPTGEGGAAAVCCWSARPGDVVIVSSDGLEEAVPLWRMARVVATALLRGEDVAAALLAEVSISAPLGADNTAIAVLCTTSVRMH
ncbi:PP2C family protein-serine/threonine phosphatase [Plantibacter flavus]|uniref:PP2C family protein-serine/threonine phosphatase n=1 Tax=Plantibacter flavus TaxID=150123 RepID=UPI00137604CA|nr:protein phosphatase 2C domain-containing protein [Plantibacter flavus]